MTPQIKQRARLAVTAAIQQGKLIRPTECPNCGSQIRIQAHHSDYSKPLEIEWLCEQCHQNLHYPNPPIANTGISVKTEYRDKLKRIADSEGLSMAQKLYNLIDHDLIEKDLKRAKKPSWDEQ